MRVLGLLVALGAVLVGCGGPEVSVIEFVEVQPPEPRIGDVVTVKVRLLDSRGLPLAGVPVNFALQTPNPAVTLNPPTALTNKGGGTAETQLVAKDRVASVIVRASSGDKSILLPSISFAGSVPHGRQFTMQCGRVGAEASGGRHAIGAYDESRGLIVGIKLECTAHVADRNGDGVPGALVSFMTEAGSIGPSEVSLANQVGDAKILHKTSYPLPFDVAPLARFNFVVPADSQTGELSAPLWMFPWTWKRDQTDTTNPTGEEPRRQDPVRTTKPSVAGIYQFAPPVTAAGRYENNPRDNLVTLIAVTAGEEGFTDSNNNGKFDDGEPYDDLSEPFVDVDDNGKWDPYERFIDVNGDRSFSPKNGQWDGNTLIWTMERVLWTGIPNVGVPNYGSGLSDTALYRVIEPTAPIRLLCPTGTTVCSQAGPPVPLKFYISDPWFNAVAQNGEGDGCTIADNEQAPIKLSPRVLNAGFRFTYPPGIIVEGLITDKRDPNLPPDQLRPRAPIDGMGGGGLDFRQSVQCLFTASSLDPYKTTLTLFGGITGKIE